MRLAISKLHSKNEGWCRADTELCCSKFFGKPNGAKAPRPQQSTLAFSSRTRAAPDRQDDQHESSPVENGREDERDALVAGEENSGLQQNDSEDVPMQDVKAEDSKSEPEGLLEEQSEDGHEPNSAGTDIFLSPSSLSILSTIINFLIR